MYKFLIAALFFTTNANAQKQTYYLLAYAQKDINLVCGTKVMINNAEISLTAEEAKTYLKTYQTQLKEKFNAKNGYKNLFVDLIYPGTVVILYEGERVYEQRRDGWDCTATYYGHIKAKDNLTAEDQLARLKTEYKYSTYNITKRWGEPLLKSDKTDDLEVRWLQTNIKVVAIVTNTRKDAALTVTVKSFKSTGGSISVENGFEKAKILETHTQVLQPRDKWSQNLDNADGFEIHTAPAKIMKEEKGIIDNIKVRIRRYITDPKGTVAPSAVFGPRS